MNEGNISNAVKVLRFATIETTKEFFHPLKVVIRMLKADHLSRISKAISTGVIPPDPDPRIEKYGNLFPVVQHLSTKFREQIDYNQKLYSEIKRLNHHVKELENNFQDLSQKLDNSIEIKAVSSLHSESNYTSDYKAKPLKSQPDDLDNQLERIRRIEKKEAV